MVRMVMGVGHRKSPHRAGWSDLGGLCYSWRMLGRIDFFDYLRAIAVTFVVVGHYRNPALPGGGIGVYIFFALSGYLVCKMILDAPEYSSQTAFRLIVRRFLRIYPPYVLSVSLVALLAWLFRPDDFAKMLTVLPGLLTFTYVPTFWVNLGVGVFWTLHVEFWFYVTLPIVALIFGRGRNFVCAILALIAASLAASIIYSATRSDTSILASPLFALMPFSSLLFGSLVAIAQRGCISVPKWSSGPVIAVSTLGLFILAFAGNPGSPLYWLLTTNLAALLTAAILACYLATPFALHIPLAAGYGRISYSVYLLHAVPAGYNLITWPQSGKSFVLFGLVLLASAAMYRVVEVPSMNLARNFRSASRATAYAASILIVILATSAHLASAKKPDRLVVFGDSIMRGLSSDKLGMTVINQSISGATIHQIAEVAENVRITGLIEKSDVVVIEGGINNLITGNHEIAEIYDGILASLKDQDAILVIGILPIADNKFLARNAPDSIIPKIKLACEARSNCRVLPVAIPDDGYVDGVHLNAGGERSLVSAIKDAIR